MKSIYQPTRHVLLLLAVLLVSSSGGSSCWVYSFGLGHGSAPRMSALALHAASSTSTADTTTTTTDESATNQNQSNDAEVSHLQKKLRYWKKEEVAKEEEHKRYLQQQVIDGKLKPIYVREGKIDTYKLRPVFDKETDRIKTEVWAIKERIKLTNAALHEEQRVLQVRAETAHKLAHAQDEIDAVIQQSSKKLLDKDHEIEMIREESTKQLSNKEQEIAMINEKTAKLIDTVRHQTSSLSEKEREIKSIKEKSNKLINAVRQQSSEKLSQKDHQIHTIREQSTKRLTDKEQEIDTLAEEIHGMIAQLEAKRNELHVQEGVLSEMEMDVQEKEVVLETLSRERASLRALVKQSWRVFKGKFSRKSKESHDVDDDEEKNEAIKGKVQEKSATQETKIKETASEKVIEKELVSA